MKNLNKYIYEGISQELKDKLLDIINSDNFNDDDAKYLLNIAAPLNKSAESISRFDKLKYYIASRYIGGQKQGELAYDAVLNILQKNDVLDSFLTNVIDPYNSDSISNTYDGKHLAESGLSKGNIYNFFKDLGLNDRAFRQLATLKYSVKNTAQGEFEVLTQLLVSDLFSRKQRILKQGPNKGKVRWMDPEKPESGNGDINTKSAIIEYKCPGARVKNQKIGAGSMIQKIFADELKKKGIKDNLLIIDGSTTVANAYNTFNILMSNHNLKFEDICDMFGVALADQLKNGGADSKEIANFFKSHKADFEQAKKDIDWSKIWSQLIGCVQLKYYQVMEGWDYIMIFCGKNGNAATASGDFVTISSEQANNLDRLYNDNRIYFNGFIDNGSGWGDAVHIFAK